MKKKVHVVGHSHWDREWYFTIEDSNVLLVEHMMFLIDFLESNPDYPCFVFDGQLSIVEDYLKVRPQDSERLKELIKNRRIHIGPWYVQCDTFNIKIESVIRNLQFGSTIANDFGHCMNIGYLPDAFGQNAYLPSIFKQIGLDYSVVQRGIYNEEAQKGLDFNWISPDGNSIKSNYIFFGYGPGKFLNEKDEYLNATLLPILNSLDSMSKGELLLPSGGDQALIRPHFIETIKKINSKLSGYELIQSNYEEYMKSVNSFENNIKGELYACQKSRVHRTIHSQRMDIKILNNKVEKLIIETLEPLTAICHLNQVVVQEEFIKNIYKQLFDAHSHDSIGGCNSDDTNQVILERLKSIQRSILGYINILHKNLNEIILKKSKVENYFTIFNLNQNSNKRISISIFTKNEKFELFLKDNKIDFEIISQKEIEGGKKIEVSKNGDVETFFPSYFKTEVEFHMNDLNIKYYVVEIREKENQKYENKKQENINEIEENKVQENKIQKSLKENKSLKFLDFKIEIDEVVKIKKQNKCYELAFESSTDYGDSYDFSPLEVDDRKIFKNLDTYEIYENKVDTIIKVVHKLEVKKSLEDSTLKELIINSKIKVDKKTQNIKIEHEIINNVSDHRIRVLFITNDNYQCNLADSGFGIVKRKNYDLKNMENWRDNKFAEMPQSIYPFERFFFAQSETNNLGILDSNVQEYEIIDNNIIAMTLFRSVGLLGRDNLITRPNRASGINNMVVETKDARLLNHKFEIKYNLIMDCKDYYQKYEILSETNYSTYQNQKLNTYLNRLDRFEIPTSSKVDILNEYFEYNKELSLSIFRINGKFIELRLFNSTNQNQKFNLESKVLKFTPVNLLLKDIDKKEIKPFEFVTFKGGFC